MTFRQKSLLRAVLSTHLTRDVHRHFFPSTGNESNSSKETKTKRQPKVETNLLFFAPFLLTRPNPRLDKTRRRRHCCCCYCYPGAVCLVPSPPEPGPPLCWAGSVSAPGFRPGEGRARGTRAGGGGLRRAMELIQLRTLGMLN